MRNTDPKFITSIAREVLVRECKQEAARITKNWQQIDPTLSQGPGEELSSLLFHKGKGRIRLDMIRHIFHSSIEWKVKSMTNEGLGKVIGVGLERGRECPQTFRKTSFHVYVQTLNNASGRADLENLASAVIAAAIWDFLEVYERAKKNNLGYSEAGAEYLEDWLTQSKSLSNGLVHAIVGTGP